jgi:hypothetical protein
MICQVRAPPFGAALAFALVKDAQLRGANQPDKLSDACFKLSIREVPDAERHPEGGRAPRSAVTVSGKHVFNKKAPGQKERSYDRALLLGTSVPANQLWIELPEPSENDCLKRV